MHLNTAMMSPSQTSWFVCMSVLYLFCFIRIISLIHSSYTENTNLYIKKQNKKLRNYVSEHGILIIFLSFS
uniref:Putative ovule protein n=1 Tax=Solanum chacoense TaxID=4108 RepID=A0A0V0IGN8_SOLCH